MLSRVKMAVNRTERTRSMLQHSIRIVYSLKPGNSTRLTFIILRVSGGLRPNKRHGNSGMKTGKIWREYQANNDVCVIGQCQLGSGEGS